MFSIRRQQMEGLREARAHNVRRAQIEAFRERGFKAEEDPETGDIVLEDEAGGTARITPQLDGISITSGEGRTYWAEFDSRRRLTAFTDPGGLGVRFEYDERGRLAAIHRGQQSTYPLEFDDRDNLTATLFPDHSATRFAYDAAGRLIAVIDRNGNEMRYDYSASGQPTRMVDPMGSDARFEYDEWDAPSAIVFPNGERHDFEYDAEGRLRTMRVNGNDHATFDADEEAGTYDVTYADGTWAHFVLSGGRLLKAANETCTVTLEYDALGHLLREETDGQVVQYLRNEVGALVGIITPEGERLTFERDREHRVCRITDWSGGRYEIGYTPSGALASINYPNGSSMTLTATSMGLAESLTVTSPRSSGRALVACQWQYDERDRVTAMIRDGETRTYRYDAESRLLEVRVGGSGISEYFECDANGNHTRDQGSASRFNALNQLVQRGPDVFTYDRLGNMTAGPCPTGDATYRYNGRGQLAAVKTSAGKTRYAYDALGRRIRKECEGKVTRYVWAGQQLLAEITTDGERTTRRGYLMFPERPFPLAVRLNDRVYYLYPGRSAEPLIMTDVQGEVVWKADYSAFGQSCVLIEEVSQPWRLAGQYFDDETGLHYVLARYYNPELGRYLTMDPLRVDGGSLNFYTYCDGDPVNRLDPTGELIFAAILIGAAIGAAIGAGLEWYRQRKAVEKGRQKEYNVGRIVGAGAIGGVIGAVGGGVGAAVEGAFGAAVTATIAGSTGVGALSGAASSVAEQCAQVGITGDPLDAANVAKEALIDGVIGGLIGAATFGVGGWLARRARRGSQAAKEMAERMARASSRSARLQELAKDPAHGNQVTRKGLHEAECGLSLEESGQLPGPIRRDPDPKGAEFIDAKGVKWDVKSFNSNYPPRKGGYELNDSLSKIEREFAKGENVIIDTTDLAPADAQQLRNAVEANGWSDRIRWYP